MLASVLVLSSSFVVGLRIHVTPILVMIRDHFGVCLMDSATLAQSGATKEGSTDLGKLLRPRFRLLVIFFMKIAQGTSRTSYW